MKRTRINPVSETNSKPGKDLVLRYEYMNGISGCELCKVLAQGRIVTWRCESLEPHHIRGGTRSRHDVVSNLIGVCHFAHIWCQETDVRGGKVLCMWVKQQKNELDLDELRDVAGQDVAAWVERVGPFENDWLEEFRLDLLEAMCAG